jgi:predicted transglutaminase-like protease
VELNSEETLYVFDQKLDVKKPTKWYQKCQTQTPVDHKQKSEASNKRNAVSL